MVFINKYIREAQPPPKKVFLGDFSQMWVVGVADSQTRSKPLKTPQITLKPFALPNLTKPWGGWVNRLGRDLPKNNGRLP